MKVCLYYWIVLITITAYHLSLVAIPSILPLKPPRLPQPHVSSPTVHKVQPRHVSPSKAQMRNTSPSKTQFSNPSPIKPQPMMISLLWKICFEIIIDNWKKVHAQSRIKPQVDADKELYKKFRQQEMGTVVASPNKQKSPKRAPTNGLYFFKCYVIRDH
jgi:hypothetical protein